MLLNILVLAMTAVGWDSSDWYEPLPGCQVSGMIDA
jgi:hypothetical protein